jgi:hypothetical protein
MQDINQMSTNQNQQGIHPNISQFPQGIQQIPYQQIHPIQIQQLPMQNIQYNHQV